MDSTIGQDWKDVQSRVLYQIEQLIREANLADTKLEEIKTEIVTLKVKVERLVVIAGIGAAVATKGLDLLVNSLLKGGGP